MGDRDLPTIAERDFRAEAEWCRLSLMSERRAAQLAREVESLTRTTELQAKLLAEATAALRNRATSPVPPDAVVVPKELMERLHDFVADSPNMVAGMQLQAEIGDALRSAQAQPDQTQAGKEEA